MSKKASTTPRSATPKPRTTGGAVAPARTISYSPKRTIGMKSGTRRTASAEASRRTAMHMPNVQLTRRVKK